MRAWVDGRTLSHGATQSVTPLSPCCEEAVKAVSAGRTGARLGVRGPDVEPGGSLFRQPVAEAEVRVDEALLRHHPLELGPKLAHVHVDGAVVRAERPRPHRRVELLPRGDG